MPDRFEIRTSASPQEAAAVIAAVERFRRDHAPLVVADAAPARSPWQRAALLEATGHDSGERAWGDPVPWGV